MKKHEMAKKMHLDSSYDIKKGSSQWQRKIKKADKHAQKGYESLNIPKGEKNEGEHNYLGKNEENKQ